MIMIGILGIVSCMIILYVIVSQNRYFQCQHCHRTWKPHFFSGYRQCESSGSRLSCSMSLLSYDSKYQAFKKEISCVKIKSEKRG